MAVYKIAMIQQKVQYGQAEENLKRAETWIAEAKRKDCVCAVLPECFDLGWANPNGRELAQEIPGERFYRLCDMAKRNEIYLVAGLTEACGTRLYNTAVFISDQGELLGKHRKINLVEGVEPMFSVGDRLGVYETKFGLVGMDICADNFPSSLAIGQCLGKMGAQIILSPCSWAVRPEDKEYNPTYPDQWIQPYTQLSQQFGLSVIGVSNVGTVEEGAWKGMSCIGSSVAVMNHGGRIVTKVLPYGEEKECMEVVEYSPK